MGIPRLSRDVEIYAKTVQLGKFPINTLAIKVTKVVIDGPSLVYHVYNALLRAQSPSALTGIHALPSYSRINACVLQFLNDLRSKGVTIKKIIFDGSLPVSKRPTRQERLEKTRLNLDNYRKLHDSNGNRSSINILSVPVGCIENETVEVEDTIWKHFTLASTQLRLLPPPPFMVGSVIEFLQHSKWSHVTHIVPGEADAYCASEAAASDSAVLSNDSDLMVYNLGANGLLIHLHSLEAVDRGSEASLGRITGQGLHPTEIAQQLGVSSILVFAYYRFMDSTASKVAITQRAREQIPVAEDPSWITFQNEYRGNKLLALEHSVTATCLHCSITGLDPRTAELIRSLADLEVPHMYLSVVLEDPSRDSAWSYGMELRQVAYSLLLRCRGLGRDTQQYGHIIEHVRNGPRIAECQVHTLSQKTLLERIIVVTDLLKSYLGSNEVNTDKPESNSNHLSALSKSSTSIANTTFLYHLLAADIVIAQRIAKSKPYQPSFSRLFPSDNISSSTTASLTWDDVHFYATIQCTLYSLRILKQIIKYLSRKSLQLQNSEIQDALLPLSVGLAGMPCVADLFLKEVSLRHILSGLRTGTVAGGVKDLLERFSSQSVLVPNNTSTETMRTNLTATSQSHDKRATATWQTTSTKAKRRKNKSTSQSVVGNSTNVNTISGRQNRGGNPFSLLQQSNDLLSPSVSEN